MFAYKNSFEDIGTYGGVWPIDNAAIPSFSQSRGIGIFCSRSSAIIQDCLFSKCGHGIYGNKNTNLDIQKNAFKRVNVGVESFGAQSFTIFKNTDMEFGRHAIVVRELVSSSSSNFLIGRNTGGIGSFPGFSTGLNENLPAIWVKNAASSSLSTKKARISTNIFNLNGLGHSGIRIQGTGNWIIDDNAINNFGNESITAYGLRIEGSNLNYIYNNTITNGTGKAFDIIGATSNRFCCNMAQKTETGVRFIGACNGTKLRNTDLSDHISSLFCEEGTVTSPQLDYGNRFYLGGGSGIHLGTITQIQSSQFRVLNHQVPYEPEIIIAPNQSMLFPWFVDLGSDLLCGNPANINCVAPSALPLNGLISTTDELDLSIVEGKFYNEKYGNMLQWEGERRLYRMLEQQPELRVGSIFTNFYNAKHAGRIDEYYQADDKINNVNITNNVWVNTISTLEASISSKNTVIQAQTLALKTAQNHIDSMAILQTIRQTMAEMDILIEQQLPLLANVEMVRSSNIQDALAQISLLPADNLFEQNSKIVNSVYLQTLAQHITTLDAAQLALITPIAHQCFLEGGNAVLMARVLYQLYEKKEFMDDSICQETNIERSHWSVQNDSDTIEDAVLLTPNPANEVLRISRLNLSNNGVAIVSIFNTNGKLVCENTLTAHQDMIHVDHLPEGIYFCRIQMGNAKTTLHRVVIIH